MLRLDKNIQHEILIWAKNSLRCREKHVNWPVDWIWMCGIGSKDAQYAADCKVEFVHLEVTSLSSVWILLMILFLFYTITSIYKYDYTTLIGSEMVEFAWFCSSLGNLYLFTQRIHRRCKSITLGTGKRLSPFKCCSYNTI